MNATIKIEGLGNHSLCGRKQQAIIKIFNRYVAFQSYNSLIALIDYKKKTIKIGGDYNYSRSTCSYRNVFFREQGFEEIAETKRLERAIKKGYINGFKITLDNNI